MSAIRKFDSTEAMMLFLTAHTFRAWPGVVKQKRGAQEAAFEFGTCLPGVRVSMQARQERCRGTSVFGSYFIREMKSVLVYRFCERVMPSWKTRSKGADVAYGSSVSWQQFELKLA